MRDLFRNVYGCREGMRSYVGGPLYHASPNAFARQGLAMANVLVLSSRFDPEELLAKTMETARAIAGVGTLGVRYAKDAIANGLNMVKEDGFRYEASLFGVLFATSDQKEGMGAFVEKRTAVFTGK